MARADEPVEPKIGVLEQRLEGRHDGDVIAEHGEVLDALGLGLQDGERGARHGGLEAEAEEHDLPLGMPAREPERIQRRVDDPHVGALRLGLQQTLARAWHAHGVAEGRENDLGPLRQRHAVVDPAARQHADRAAGAVHQFDRLGQHLLEAVAEDRMGVPAAHFHDLERAQLADLDLGDQRLDLADQRTRLRGVPEVVEILHPKPSAGWRIRRRPMRP
jgi:hypothetical protein